MVTAAVERSFKENEAEINAAIAKVVSQSNVTMVAVTTMTNGIEAAIKRLVYQLAQR